MSNVRIQGTIPRVRTTDAKTGVVSTPAKTFGGIGSLMGMLALPYYGPQTVPATSVPILQSDFRPRTRIK